MTRVIDRTFKSKAERLEVKRNLFLPTLSRNYFLAIQHRLSSCLMFATAGSHVTYADFNSPVTV